MDDAFESMEDQDELEEEAEVEVEKVLWELTAGKTHLHYRQLSLSACEMCLLLSGIECVMCGLLRLMISLCGRLPVCLSHRWLFLLIR